MALQVTKMVRVFEIERAGKPKELSDPDKNLSPDDVLKHYTPTYPELTNAKIEGPKIEGKKAKYKMKTTVGTKG